MMLSLDLDARRLCGPSGELPTQGQDEVLQRLLMLIEGECFGLGATVAAAKYGLTRQRYYQVLNDFQREGSDGLRPRKRGPKTNYRRTPEVVRQVVRHRFLDEEASAAVIHQKLVQGGMKISERSVSRIIEDFGLQKRGSTGMGHRGQSSR